MIAVLLTGAVLGFSAGVAPGPLLVFVISETLRFGVRSGFKVAAAPLITDPPIIVLTPLLICFTKKTWHRLRSGPTRGLCVPWLKKVISA